MLKLQEIVTIYITRRNLLYILSYNRREGKKAVFSERNVTPVSIVAPTYMNPRQKKDDMEKRRKRQKEDFDKNLQEAVERELPEDSTVSYYV